MHLLLNLLRTIELEQTTQNAEVRQNIEELTLAVKEIHVKEIHERPDEFTRGFETMTTKSPETLKLPEICACAECKSSRAMQALAVAFEHWLGPQYYGEQDMEQQAEFMAEMRIACPILFGEAGSLWMMQMTQKCDIVPMKLVKRLETGMVDRCYPPLLQHFATFLVLLENGSEFTLPLMIHDAERLLPSTRFPSP